MYCLKCGRESSKQQVFCDSCLQGMTRYPVKPDARVQLPQRDTPPPSKKAGRQKRIASPEELLPLLKRRNRRLVCAVIALSLVTLLALAALIWKDRSLPLNQHSGKNYNIRTSGTTEG